MSDLSIVAFIIGGAGSFIGICGLIFPGPLQTFCRNFPRNEKIGSVLMLIDCAWGIYLLYQTDLGDWNYIKKYVYYLSPVIYGFIILYVNNYLGARSLAVFLILIAKPVLSVCILHDESSRLVITILAYIWIVAGICFTGAPHWMRNCISYSLATPSRWKWACGLKLAAGAALILLGLFVY